MLFDDKTKGIAQAYLSMLGEKTKINESHFKVGDRVECIASGMKGTVIKLDKEDGADDEKYYTVKQDSGKEMKYAPNELKKISMNESKLDPVNPKAVKKDFDDRADKDIDNDGDVDDSDEYLHNRRKAISKAVKKEAIEIEMQKKSKMSGNNDDDNGNDDDDDNDDNEVAMKDNNKMKVKKNDKKNNNDDEMTSESSLKDMRAAAEKRAGSVMRPKATKPKARPGSMEAMRADAEKRRMREDLEWDWDAILEAPEEEIDAMIEEMSDDDLESFVSEFESIQEGDNWYQASTNSVQPMNSDGRETLDPRAPADRAFANAHRQNVNIKDYPGKDKPVTNAKAQAPVRPGEKRNPEPKKTLSDIRNKMK